MGIQRQLALVHWNFFLAIEEDLYVLSRYVDFAGNDNTYSIEIARLLLSTSAEVDVVLKQLCRKLNANKPASSINTYQQIIVSELPQFIEFEVTIPRHGLTLKPWSNWGENHPPFWWQAHNKVKHHRHDHFDKGNLKNCLNSVAALYIAVLFLYTDEAQIGELMQIPKLFNVSDIHFGGAIMGRFGHSFQYNLD